MVIESLKAVQTALKETMKDKDMSDASRKRLKESETALQKLIEEARKAAKEAEAYQGEEEEEAGEEGEGEEEEAEAADGVKPGHKVTKTMTIKHDGPDGDGEEEEGDADDGDGDGDEEPKDKKDGDSEESKRGYIRSLLREAGIPKKIWALDRLVTMSLKEAKAEIAEKKNLLSIVREQIEGETPEMVDASEGEPLHESNGGENLNSLFTGCAQ